MSKKTNWEKGLYINDNDYRGLINKELDNMQTKYYDQILNYLDDCNKQGCKITKKGEKR